MYIVLPNRIQVAQASALRLAPIFRVRGTPKPRDGKVQLIVRITSQHVRVGFRIFHYFEMTSDTPKQHFTPPDEVFRLLPAYLESVEDLLSLRLLSKRHHELVDAGTAGPVLLRLCYLSRRVCFRPSPLLLLAWLTPAIVAWANRSGANRDRLKAVIPLGADELLHMAVFTPAIARKVAWSFDKARAVTDWRLSTLEPVSDLVDRCVGEKWYGQENFWDGAADDARTLAGDPDDAPLHLAIYGEMVGSAWDAWLEANAEREAKETLDEASARRAVRGPDSRDPLLPPLGRPSVRADLLKYIAPDRELHWRNMDWVVHLSATGTAPVLVDPGIDDYPVSEVGTADPMGSEGDLEGASLACGGKGQIGADTDADTDIAHELDDSGAVNGLIYYPERPPSPWRLSALYVIRNQPVTPYGSLVLATPTGPRRPAPFDKQGCYALDHLITRSPHWGRLMASIRSLAGGDFEDPPVYRAQPVAGRTVGWRQQLWEQCFYLLGLDGISIIAQVNIADRRAERCRILTGQIVEGESYRKEGYLNLDSVCATGPAWEKLRRWRSRIASLKVEPRTIDLIGSRIYEAPHLFADVQMLSFGGPE